MQRRQGGPTKCGVCVWQFFARGAFALPLVTGFQGPQPGFAGALRTQAWAVRALALSGLDWPIRRLSGGASPFDYLMVCPLCGRGISR